MFSGSMASTQEGFRLAPVMGRSAWTTFMRDCTSNRAFFMSVPYQNSTLTIEKPSCEVERTKWTFFRSTIRSSMGLEK